jgi:hypothetical protein
MHCIRCSRARQSGPVFTEHIESSPQLLLGVTLLKTGLFITRL